MNHVLGRKDCIIVIGKSVTKKMKIREKLICLLLVIVLLSQNCYFSLAKEESNEMDALDILIASYRKLAVSSKSDVSLWNEIIEISQVEPLYDTKLKIIAYYVGFYPTGYAIVNNSRKNPILLEFSNQNYSKMEELKRENNNKLICYGGADYLYLVEENSYEQSGKIKELNKFELSIDDENTLEYNCHMEKRKFLIEKYFSSEKNRTYTLSELKTLFGIIDWDDMPEDAYVAGFLNRCGTINYGTTGEFYGVNGADNHCGATAAFNVVLYYSNYLREPELLLDSREETFTAIHEYIGNGPVMFSGYNNGLNCYLEDVGYSYNYSIGGTYLSIKNGIDQNQMSTLLLYGNLINWHMVNAVGYREYFSGTNYIRIVDGWESNSLRFILSNNFFGSYTTWISTLED